MALLALVALAIGGNVNGQSDLGHPVVLQVPAAGGVQGALGRALLPQVLDVSAAETAADPRGDYFAGYRDAGGAGWLEAHLDALVWCESRWLPWVVGAGGHLGLAQFSPETWATVAARTGLWDWTDPYSQGVNTAELMRLAEPAGQWSCW